MGYVFEVDERLRKVIIFAHGVQVGNEWLEKLPLIVEKLCKKWDLEPIGIPNSGAMSCCVFVQDKKSSPLVLKIPVDPSVSTIEVQALSSWATAGLSPIVVEFDKETGAFLMERVIPGTIAEPTGDGTSVDLITDVLRKQSQALCDLDAFPNYMERVNLRYEWADERFRGTKNEAGLALTESAMNLASRLEAVPAPTHLLHGDLQPKNVLQSRDGAWYLIDPMPCCGPLESDLGLWISIQDEGLPCEELIRRLGTSDQIDEELLASWVAVFTVLELRPYSTKYLRRMVDFLHTDLAAGLLKGVDVHATVDSAVDVTSDPRP